MDENFQGHGSLFVNISYLVTFAICKTNQSCFPAGTGIEEIKGGIWEKSDSLREDTVSFGFFLDFPT